VGVPQPHSVLFVPVTLAVLVYASPSRATEPGYQISAGVIETDNVQLAPGGTRDTIIEQEGSLIWHEQRPLFSADVDADLSHLTYVPRTFSDQVIGNFIGQARFALVPQALFWNISDNFGQGVSDPFAAVTPENRENINYFSTGPQALLPLGSQADLLDLNATYGRTYYQKSDIDNQRFGGGVGYVHRLSATTEVSLNLHDERVDYSNDVLNPDFSQAEAFAHLDSKGSRTTLSADLGYNRLSGLGSSTGSVLARAEVSRKISASSTVSLSAGHEYSDAVSAFQISQVLGGANLNTQQTVQAGGPFTATFETAGWNFFRSRTGFGLQLSHFKDAYVQGSSLDDTRTQIDGNISRLLTPTIRIVLAESYYRQVFTSSVGSATQIMTDARLTWQMSRRLSMAFDYNLAKRHADIADTGYTENRIWLSIAYGRLAQMPPGPAAPPLPFSPTTY
jgi:hypothetical protein